MPLLGSASRRRGKRRIRRPSDPRFSPADPLGCSSPASSLHSEFMPRWSCRWSSRGFSAGFASPRRRDPSRWWRSRSPWTRERRSPRDRRSWAVLLTAGASSVLRPSKPVSGSSEASVSIVVFTQEDCAYCDELRDRVMPEIEREFGRRVRIDYRPASDLPAVRKTPTLILTPGRTGIQGRVIEGLPTVERLRGAIQDWRPAHDGLASAGGPAGGPRGPRVRPADRGPRPGLHRRPAPGQRRDLSRGVARSAGRRLERERSLDRTPPRESVHQTAALREGRCPRPGSLGRAVPAFRRPADGAYDGHVRILAPKETKRSAPESLELIRAMRLGRRPADGTVLRPISGLHVSRDVGAAGLRL
jgi:hypothetical protein